jgi:type VI secretion system secreted protein VgrG
MAASKQADRLMQFSSPLGKDVLLIESLEGAEGISRLFAYHAELLTDVGTAIDPKSIVGSKVTVAIALSDVKGSRWINGIVASFEQRGGDENFDIYRARIVPSMWQMTLSSTCRVFQDKTVLEIVKAVIGDYGLSLSDQTSGSYKPLEYCTQYSESDFHFVSRLLEESGIYYYFEHTDQDNKIVLGDSRSAYQDCPLSATVPYAVSEAGHEGAYGARVTEFTATSTMVSGKHATADYNFVEFKRVDASVKNSASQFGKNAYEQFLYSAGEEGYLKGSTTKSTANLFLEARALASDATAEVFRGEGNLRSFCAGYTFTLTDNPHAAFNRKYLLTAVTLHADQLPPYRSTAAQKRTEYSNRFTAVSSDIVFKPALTFEKPKIYGPQTAFVVVPAGEDIYIDKFGRVCIQFFWDRLRPANKVDNTWVRVAQSWAGKGWGAHFWPRGNQEVIVQFLNGDPDNPVITGSLYNGMNVPPYDLPDHSTRSGIVTRSTKGGSAQNANELRFEDKKGSEQIYIHAEKDLDTSIEHDRRITVGNNDSLTVTKNQTEEVDGDFNRQVKGNTIEKVGGNSDLNIGGNQTESVGGNHGLSVSSNQSISVGSAYSLNANNTIYINGGMSVVIQAGMELSLVASGNFITIGPSGVAISGTMVLINSGGAAGSGSAGSTGSPGSPGTPDKVVDDESKGNSSSMVPGSPSRPGTPPSGLGAAMASMSSAAGGTLSSAAGAAAGLAGQAGQTAEQAQQAAQQAVDQAKQLTQQAAQQAQQAAAQAQQAAKQAEQQAQQAVNQVTQEAQQIYQQANQAVQQAVQVVQQATAQGQAAAIQALAQAQSELHQCNQAASQAIQQANQQAMQVQQQAQQVAAQAQQAAQQAAIQAQQAAQQTVQQGQQAAQQAQQAAQQAQLQAQQAAAQAQQAAMQAQQQAQQAAQQVQQSASQATQQAQQASQAAQQSASQAISQAQRGF